MKWIGMIPFGLLLYSAPTYISSMEPPPDRVQPPLTPAYKASVSDQPNQLHEECKRGNLAAVRILINENRDRISELDDSRSSLLQLAISNVREHTALVEFLIDRGAPLDFPGYLSGLLFSALRRGHSEVALLLLKYGADINAVDQKKRTALHYAAAKGSEALVRALIARGAKLQVLDDSQSMPWQVAHSNERILNMKLLMEAADKQQSWWVRYLAPLFGVAPELPCYKEELGYAAQKGDIQTIRSLIDDKKINVTFSDDGGITALHIAASVGHANIVEEFLRRQVPVNIQTRVGLTPLHYAVRNGQTHVVRLLLAHRANVNAQDKWGDTPFEAAGLSAEKMIKYQEMIHLLADYGAHLGTSDAVRRLFEGRPITSALLFEDEARVINSALVALRNSDRHNVYDIHGALVRVAAKGYLVVVAKLLMKMPKQSIDWERIHQALECAEKNNHKECFGLIVQFCKVFEQPASPPREATFLNVIERVFGSQSEAMTLLMRDGFG